MATERARRQPSVTVTCEICGEPILGVRASRIAKGYGRYHQVCYGLSKRTRVTITCLVCGNPRDVKPVDIERGGGKYCGTACARKSRERTDRQAALDAWRRVDTTGLHWPFTGATNSAGYGHLKMNGRWKLMSHVAWFLATGAWPQKREHIGHTLDCGADACCRNDDEGTYTVGSRVYPRRGHLFLADASANKHDEIAKGRRPNSLRRRAGLPELTEGDVVVIRSRAAAGETQVAIARSYGVSEPTISYIVRRASWRHVP